MFKVCRIGPVFIHTYRLAKAEDEQFALTNDFTTADEGSTIKLRDMYRHMQHNFRATALRDHKKLYDKNLVLADHCMVSDLLDIDKIDRASKFAL